MRPGRYDRGRPSVKESRCPSSNVPRGTLREEARVQRAGRVPHRYVENRATATREAHRMPPPLETSAAIVCTCPGIISAIGVKRMAIFVSERKIAQQIADRRDPPLLERCRTLRSDASQVLHRVASRFVIVGKYCEVSYEAVNLAANLPETLSESRAGLHAGPCAIYLGQFACSHRGGAFSRWRALP